MIAFLGLLGVLIGAAGAAWLTWGGIRRDADAESLARPVALLVGGATLAMAALVMALLADDFSVEYVANHSASTTPIGFKIASAWGALEGSIVLWGLVLALTTWWVLWSRRGRLDRLDGIALAILGTVSLFFFGLMASVANPFHTCVDAAAIGCTDSSWWPLVTPDSPPEGRGPNPLLQNHILMAIHPPMLYLGYVGLTAPFAYALGSLVLGTPGTAWVTRTKRLTLLAWSFLTIGILLGGWWSYEVLGWGGYWGWDPVENASLLPWITATAFIHSSTVQVRKGALESWNYLLVIATFALTILGTFLTRSGVITSVHSFTQSGVSPALLAFFLIIVVVGLGLFATRAHLVTEGGRVGSPLSREGAMLINNILLSAWGATVLIGTVYPILVEAFATRTVGVGRGFFDATSIPLAFALLLVMGMGPVTPWKRASWTTVARRLVVPAQVALVIGALAALGGVRSRGALLAILLASFTAATPVAELFRLARARVTKGETRWAAVLGIVRRDRGYWGGMLSHIGVAILAVGIAGSAGLAMQQRELTLPRNQPVEVFGYELEFRTGFAETEPRRSIVGATIELRRNGRSVDILRPAINDYRVQAVPTPAVHSGIDEDLYVSLRAVDQNRALIDVHVFPLQWMVWLGGFVIAGGGLWSLSGRRRARDELPVRS